MLFPEFTVIPPALWAFKTKFETFWPTKLELTTGPNVPEVEELHEIGIALNC